MNRQEYSQHERVGAGNAQTSLDKDQNSACKIRGVHRASVLGELMSNTTDGGHHVGENLSKALDFYTVGYSALRHQAGMGLDQFLALMFVTIPREFLESLSQSVKKIETSRIALHLESSSWQYESIDRGYAFVYLWR